MTNTLMILKTQNLKNDQRVLKELDSLSKAGASPEVFVARNCDTPKEYFKYPINDTSIVGGASTPSKSLQAIGILQFYSNAIKFIVSKNYSLIWICDPIMFLLVSIVKKIKPHTKVVWDHHELPPSWFLESKFLMQLFRRAYKSADIVVHANDSRKRYLEHLLNHQKKFTYIISNYSDSQTMDEEKLDDSGEEWLEKAGNFIYLQNSLQENRYGAEVITAALQAGLKVFHAGKIDQAFIDKYSLNSKDLYLSDYLNIKQINRVLKSCAFTVILYKQNSLNQIYCDANRLYQAMSVGAPIIIGNNPTLIESSSNYEDKLILDCITQQSLEKAMKSFSNKAFKREPILFSWSIYDTAFTEIVQRCRK